MPSAKFPSGLSSLDTGVHEHGGVVALAQQANLHALEINAVETALGAALANVLRYVSGAGKSTVVDGDFVSPANGAVAVHYNTTNSKTYVSVRAAGAWVVIAGPLP
jgi:hypothetical protein